MSPVKSVTHVSGCTKFPGRVRGEIDCVAFGFLNRSLSFYRGHNGIRFYNTKIVGLLRSGPLYDKLR